MSRNQTDIICFHEAGHVVMAFACETLVQSVSIIPEPMVLYRHSSSSFPYQFGVLISLAGMMGDYIHWEYFSGPEKDEEEFSFGNQSDFENV